MLTQTLHKTFTAESHERFLRLSNDYNPIHADPITSRRAPSGGSIIHGVHTLLWTLDCLAQTNLYRPGLKGLKVQFLKPAYINDTVHLEITRSASNASVRARLSVDGEEISSVTFDWDAHDPTVPPSVWSQSFPQIASRSTPCDLSFEEIGGFQGTVPFAADSSDVASYFPSAARAIGVARLDALVSCSYVIGMVVPGMHSIFSGLHVSLSELPTAPTRGLHFQVLSITKRFRAVRIAVLGPGIHGTLDAIHRLPPAKQADIATVSARVKRDEFRDSVALVVGGSRGLGEVTAKLLAAGGSNVVITYLIGADDAQRVTSEIMQAGHRCTSVRYDARQRASDQIAQLNPPPTHIYYFATPRISKRTSAFFDVKRLQEYGTFYVTGFLDLAQASLTRHPEGLRAFYPSSVFVNERPPAMTEYAMAKAAGEILCTDLNRFVRGIKVVTHRLPRLPTDQTLSPTQAAMPDPIDVLLPIVREMHLQP